MFTVRPAVHADLPMIVEILNQVIQTRATIAILEETTVDARREWFESHLDARFPLLVATHGKRVVGWSSLSAYRPGREALSRTVEVGYGVEASMRGQGVGTAMLTEILRLAREAGHRVVIAILLDTNSRSRNLLEKCGFERWGHLPQVADMDGLLVGHDYYGRLLRPKESV
jgi:L-amino acid N-acyltransferase YncA